MSGYDVIIVATNHLSHEEHWQKRLKELEGVLYEKGTKVIVVSVNDWENKSFAESRPCPLYAYKKAQEKGKFKYQQDLFELQRQGASVALYFTAGVRKRLFPLLASEQNDLGALLLPGSLNDSPLTLLETLLMQTAPLAKGRDGRLCIFYCEQLLISAASYPLPPKAHVEFFQTNTPSPFAFSLSSSITFALLREFQKDFEQKHEQALSEAPFWSPLALDPLKYRAKFPSKAAEKYYCRINNFKEKFIRLHSPSQLINKAEMGKGGIIWSYKTAKSYYETSLKLASPCMEGQLMHLFYQTKKNKKGNSLVIADQNSCLIDCEIQSGTISGSVLIGVRAEFLEVKNCVIIKSQFSHLKAEECLLYRVEEKKPLKLASSTIRSDVQLPSKESKTNQHFKIYSHLERDGKKDWKALFPSNSHSFDEVFHQIQTQFEMK